MYIFPRFTDNIFVGKWIVAVVVIVVFLLFFPIQLDNYLYIDTKRCYAQAEVALYRIFPLITTNTNGLLKKDIKPGGNFFTNFIKDHLKNIYYNLPIKKIIQLGDYGVCEGGGAYAALIQNCLTIQLYNIIALQNRRAKLKNYIILNSGSSQTIYCAKITGVINLLSIIKMFIVAIKEKVHEHI